MAVTKGGTGKLVQLEEKEGVSELSDDYMVRTVGVPVPLLRSKAAFDEDSPPAQGLAISERLGLMFVAHHGGFFMANTKDVLSLAKDLKESNKASSIQDLSIVDISLGGIPFLQLSLDSSTLAACCGGELQFFSTDSLIKKVKGPFMSRSLDAPNHVKDFRWDKSGRNAYVALSSDGVLYHGDLRTQHTVVAESVEAVDWSDKGDLIAIAQMNSVCILSSDFAERCHMPLPPPQADDATTCKIEVDSIKWVRNDSIVIGCHQRSEDGISGGYLVRVITSNGSDLPEVSHNVVVTFDSFFLSFNETLLTSGRGPLLFMDYLKFWELAIAVNRKSIDDHIVLLGWFDDHKLKEPKVIEFQQDKWMPRIQMKANGEENLVVGFCMDLNVDDGKFEIEMDGGGRRQLSYCIMLCLTVDGMLTLFRVAKRSAPVVVPLAPKSSTLGTKGYDTIFAGVQHERNTAVSGATKHTVEVGGGDDKHLISDIGPARLGVSVHNIEKQSATIESHDLQKSVIQITDESGSSCLQVEKSSERGDTAAKPGVQYSAGGSSYKSSPLVPVFGRSQLHVDKGPPRTTSTVKSGVESSTVESTNRKSPQVTGPGGFMSKEFQKPFSYIKGTVDVGSSVMQNVLLTTDRSSSQNFLEEEEDSLVEQRGKGFTVKSSIGLSEYVASPHGYPRLSQKDFVVPLNQKVLAKQDIKLNSLSPVESDDFSRAFENVKEMAKELDCLLFSIEAEEGYLDESPVFQKDCILGIEESIRSLSKRCRDWKSITNGHLQDIQNLQNKAMQAIAKEVHMKRMVRQAKNSEYWDLWDRQKLRPEFEVKRLKLFKAKQDLIKQLIELGRHFNVLELNKFGGEAIKSRVKASQTIELSRRGHELHSLYSTMNSQLAASTHLSECLSKQMAALNIAPSTVKRHEATKQLFESIGLAYSEDDFQSPHFNSADSAVHLSKKPLSNREEKSNIFQHSEPETTRRRRDSVDQNLVGFEPPKTIVKRILKEKFPDVSVDMFSPEKSKRVITSQARLVGSSYQDSEVSVALPSTNSHLHDQYPASEGNCFEAMKWSSKMPSPLSFNESKSKYTALSYLASGTPETSVLRVNMLPSTVSESSLTLHSANIEGSITYDGKSSTVPSTKGGDTSIGQTYFVTKTGATAQILNTKLSEQSRITQVPSKVMEQGKATVHAGLQCVTSSDEKLEDNDQKYAACSEHRLPVPKSKFISSDDPSLLPAGPSMEALQSTHSTGSVQGATTLSTGTSILPKSASSSPSTLPVSTLLVPSPVSAFSPSRSASILNQPLYVHSLSPSTTDSLSEARRQLSADTERIESGKILSTATTSQPTLAPPILSSSQASMGSASAVSSSAETSTSSLLPPSSRLFSVSPTSSSATSSPILSSGASLGAALAPASPPVYVDLDHPKGSLSHHTVGLADGHATHGLHETEPISGLLLSDSKNNIRTSSAVLASPSTFVPPTLHVSKSSPQEPDEGAIVSKSDFLPTPATISKAGVSTGFSFGSTPSNLVDSSSSISMSSQQTTVVITSAAENMDTTTVQEDEMEEELSDSTTTLNLGSLDGFGLGSTTSNAPKSNLFGGSFSGSVQANTAISLSIPSGELFKPASFSLPASQPSKPSGSSLFSGAFGGMKNAMPVNNAFGQPAQIGVAQQALGSVLGSFGQSRQFGVGSPGVGLASPNAFGGGFAAASVGGGFAGAAASGGFAAAASAGGGFAAAGATTGGFSAFSSKPGGGGSSSSNLTASPLSDRFTQIRK